MLANIVYHFKGVREYFGWINLVWIDRWDSKIVTELLQAKTRHLAL
jgi:hypothetical protein